MSTAAALTAASSICRLPMTGPQRRATASCAAPNGPRAASTAASLTRDCAAASAAAAHRSATPSALSLPLHKTVEDRTPIS